MTIPLQKLKVFWSGFCLFLNPAKYATVIGKSDNEHGPKLVNSPAVKTIRVVNGVGLLSPLSINCSPWRVKSEINNPIEEMFKNRFATLRLIPDYRFKSLFEGFLINKSEDSIEALTNKADISRLEINEFPP